MVEWLSEVCSEAVRQGRSRCYVPRLLHYHITYYQHVLLELLSFTNSGRCSDPALQESTFDQLLRIALRSVPRVEGLNQCTRGTIIRNEELHVTHITLTAVVAKGNGEGKDRSNLYTTFGRGLQQTDSNGMVQFETVFSGHYFGVAPHIHILAHFDLPADGYLRTLHDGRLLFDQHLISEVEAMTPDNLNKQPLTTNREDVVLDQGAVVTGPFVRYAFCW